MKKRSVSKEQTTATTSPIALVCFWAGEASLPSSINPCHFLYPYSRLVCLAATTYMGQNIHVFGREWGNALTIQSCRLFPEEGRKQRIRATRANQTSRSRPCAKASDALVLSSLIYSGFLRIVQRPKATTKSNPFDSSQTRHEIHCSHFPPPQGL